MKRLRRPEFLIAVEIALGSTISILLADWAKLLFSASAGITTLLTIQNTRDKTLRTSLQRYAAFLLMLLLVRLVMQPLNFSAPSFGLFLLLFVSLCHALRMQAVMPSNAVLATHFLIQGHMQIPLIMNAFWLLTIGAGVGVLLNLLIPHQRQPLTRYRDEIESSLRAILSAIGRRAAGLGRKGEALPEERTAARAAEDRQMADDLEGLERRLADYEQAARDEGANRLQRRDSYPIRYFQMRSRQTNYLRRMWSNMQRMGRGHQILLPVAAFLMQIAERFSESNNAVDLLRQQALLEADYDISPLPESRAEFEDRALMYVLLQDLRSLLEIKRDFVAALTAGELKDNW
ncbi:MAG: aromatic acid exporter family protein [Christensenellales bacterium]